MATFVQPTQELPSWLTLVPTEVTDANGDVSTSFATMTLPLTYYGPSVSIFTGIARIYSIGGVLRGWCIRLLLAWYIDHAVLIRGQRYARHFCFANRLGSDGTTSTWLIPVLLPLKSVC